MAPALRATSRLPAACPHTGSEQASKAGPVTPPASKLARQGCLKSRPARRFLTLSGKVLCVCVVRRFEGAAAARADAASGRVPTHAAGALFSAKAGRIGDPALQKRGRPKGCMARVMVRDTTKKQHHCGAAALFGAASDTAGSLVSRLLAAGQGRAGQSGRMHIRQTANMRSVLVCKPTLAGAKARRGAIRGAVCVRLVLQPAAGHTSAAAPRCSRAAVRQNEVSSEPRSFQVCLFACVYSRGPVFAKALCSAWCTGQEAHQ